MDLGDVELPGQKDLSLTDSVANLQIDTGDTPKDLSRDSTLQVEVKPPSNAAKGQIKKPAAVTKNPAELNIAQTLQADSVLRQQAVIPTGSEAEDKISEAMRVATTAEPIVRDSLDTDLDSTQLAVDTAKTRVVRAFYNVRLFKSDLQAVADSVYYGMADSMFRFMGRPMIWAQDSQISADTIFMQIVNQQMDNALLKDNAFMVNATLDTLKFNQLKGRRITAFFTNNNIDRLYVDGNAENISFSVNEKTRRITEMFHDRGSRIKVKLENREIIDYITVQGVDQKIYPFSLVTQENEILPGFIWRPQDRPTSKEDLLNRKREFDRGGSSIVDDNANADAAPSGSSTADVSNDSEQKEQIPAKINVEAETSEVEKEIEGQQIPG